MMGKIYRQRKFKGEFILLVTMLLQLYTTRTKTDIQRVRHNLSPYVCEEQRRRSRWIERLFSFKTNQIIDMKRKRNGAEIRSMRPDDMLFPLFPMQNPIPKSITLRGKE